MKSMKRVLPIVLAIALITLVVAIKTPKTYASTTQGISAQSIILMEQSTGKVMYERNANDRKLTASIAKIMTTILVIEKANNIEEKVRVSESSIKEIGSSVYLEKGDKLKLIDLLHAVMLRSGNDASVLVAEHISGNVEKFAYEMNELAKKIGMHNSTFENPTGLDEKTKNYSTAYDMALLTKYAMENNTFKKIAGTTKYTCTTDNGRTYVWHHKHKLVSGYEYIKGGKTGYTEAAKRTLVTFAEKDNMDLIVVSLNASNDWIDHKNLFDYGFNNYEMKTVVPAGKVNHNNILHGDNVYIDKAIKYPIKINSNKSISTKFKLLNEKDDVTGKIGCVEIFEDNQLVLKKELYNSVISVNSESESSITKSISRMWKFIMDFF